MAPTLWSTTKATLREHLSGPPRAVAWILSTALVVMVIYLYFGKAHFWQAAFPALTASPDGDWAAYGLEYGAVVVLWILVPLLVAKLVLGKGPGELGWRLGDWRFGSKAVAVAVIVLTPVLYLNGADAGFQAEYPLVEGARASVGSFFLSIALYGVYYVAWESFYRGFIGLGLKKELGVVAAIMAQTIPSTIMHIGKPFGETFSAIFAGIAFGLVAYRTRSFLYVLVIHWYVGAMNDLFCIIHTGGFGQ